MTSFRPRLKQLILKRSLEIGRQLTQTQVAEEAGVLLGNGSALMADGVTFDRIDAETFYALLDYFHCTFEELIERSFAASISLRKTISAAPSAPMTAISAVGQATTRSAPRSLPHIARYAPPYALRRITVIFGTVAAE